MTLTELLQQEAKGTYAAAESLIKMVKPEELSWKPTTGKNWMTVGQLIRHCGDACGAPIKGFVTGDWGMPAGMKVEDLPPEEMLPPAEKMPSATVEQALDLLARDRETALRFIAEAGEENLLTRTMTAPWGGHELPLFQHLQGMIAHLAQHKGQLFYYLKLLGRDVNTMHLWGM